MSSRVPCRLPFRPEGASAFGALWVLIAATTVAVAQQPSTAPTFRTESPLVVVDAVVVDRDGRPITGLTASDFEVRDEGVAQQVELFQVVSSGPGALPDAPSQAAPAVFATNIGPDAKIARTFVVFFDDVHLTREHGDRAKGAVARFFDSELRDGDLVSLVVPGKALRWHARLPDGRAQLARIVGSLQGLYAPDPSTDRMSDYEAYRIHVFSDEVVAERVDRRWRNARALGREPVDLQRDRGFEPQNRGGNIGIIKQDIAIRAAAHYTNTAARNRATFSALARTIESLGSVRGRKSLILISPGFIEDQERRDSRDVIDAARRANVALYFVDARGLVAGSSFGQAEAVGPVDFRDLGATLADIALDAEGAETLAVQTGGFSVRNKNDLEDALRRIARESDMYYLLGYQPSETAKPDSYRRIEVRVNRRDVEVRARRGYYAGLRAAGGKRAVRAAGDVTEELDRATDSPFDLGGIPLRASAYVFGESSPGKALTVLAAEVDLRAFQFARQGAQLRDVAEFRMLATHQESGTTERYERQVEMTFPATAQFGEDAWHTLTQEFPLQPGTYQARVAVRDRHSGKIGAVTYEFEVPEPGAFRVTSPVITDTVETSSGGGVAPKPVLVVRRAFPAGSTLYYQFSVIGAARDPAAGTRVAASHEVRRRSDGTVVKRMEPRMITPSPGGALTRFSGLSLSGIEAGEYELVLRVVDQLSNRSLERLEPFTILPHARRAGNP
jgi:VWFA-related protein